MVELPVRNFELVTLKFVRQNIKGVLQEQHSFCILSDIVFRRQSCRGQAQKLRHRQQGYQQIVRRDNSEDHRGGTNRQDHGKLQRGKTVHDLDRRPCQCGGGQNAYEGEQQALR